MKMRKVMQTLRAIEVTEGAGVSVHRTIGSPTLKNLDPFLLLDHFSSNDPDDYIAGFPDHPHRGFITLTYMLDGHMLHQDSMGNKGDLIAGGAQWMKAANGVIHSEMPQQVEGLMRGFQLWINLPAAEKMTSPEYQEYSPRSIPVVESNDMRVKIICGEYTNTKGLITDSITQLQYFDVRLIENQQFSHILDQRFNSFIYLLEGEAEYSGAHYSEHTMLVLGEGDIIQLRAVNAACRFILVAGLPIGEPIVQHGPFVMNTKDEIEQAIDDYRNGTLVSGKAVFHSG